MTTHTTTSANPNPSTPAPAPRVMLTAEQAAEALGIGRTTLFALLKRGEINSVRIGRLRRIPQSELDAYAARLMAEQNPSATDGTAPHPHAGTPEPGRRLHPESTVLPERPDARPRLLNRPEPR